MSNDEQKERETYYEFLIAYVVQHEDGRVSFHNRRIASPVESLTIIHLMMGVRDLMQEHDVGVQQVAVLSAIGPVMVPDETLTAIIAEAAYRYHTDNTDGLTIN